MIKTSFSLVSNGFKLLSIILTLFLVGLTIIFIVFRPLWYAILLSVLIAAFCLFATILSFCNRIVIDIENKQLIVYFLRSKKIDFHNLRSVEIDTRHSINVKKYCFIVFKLNDGTTYKISGYSSIFNHKSVFYTQRIVND